MIVLWITGKLSSAGLEIDDVVIAQIFISWLSIVSIHWLGFDKRGYIFSTSSSDTIKAVLIGEEYEIR